MLVFETLKKKKNTFLNSNMCFCSRLYGNLKCFDPRRRKTCLNGKRTCWKDRKKKRTRETQCNHIPQAAQQLVAADTTAQIPRQHQQREEKLKKRTTSHAGEEKERNKKNSPPMQPVFAAEVSNRKAAHLDMNPHQRWNLMKGKNQTPCKDFRFECWSVATPYSVGTLL